MAMRTPVETWDLAKSEKMLEAMFYVHDNYMEADHKIPYSEDTHIFAMNRLNAQVKRLRAEKEAASWIGWFRGLALS